MKTNCLILAIILFPLTSFSFDGQRKGLNLGIGLGFSPYASFDWNNSIDENNVAASAKFSIGYGIDNNNIITYQGMGSGVTSTSFNDTFILQGLWGPRWIHYFGESDHKSFFGSAGFGWLRFWSEYSDVCGSGLGYEIGMGYEIMRHFQLELFYFWGETESNKYSRTTDHSVLSHLVSAYAFRM